MLVLTRKVGERIVLDNGVTVTVTRITGNGAKVRLGIDAPADVTIHREELLRAIQERERLENGEATVESQSDPAVDQAVNQALIRATAENAEES